MLRTHSFWSVAVLGLSLVAAPECFAQHRGGSVSHGSAHVSVSHAIVRPSVAPSRPLAIHQNVARVGVRPVIPVQRGVIPGRAIQDRRDFGDHGRNLFGLGIYGGPGYYGIGGWPYSYYANDYYGYYPPYDYDSPVVPNGGYYGGPQIGDQVPTPQVQDLVAHIDVVVPDPDATVWFNGFQTTSRGTTRHFDTPQLQPGGNYSYTIRATWTQGGQPKSAEQEVRVSPGQNALVDFTRPPGQQLPIVR